MPRSPRAPCTRNVCPSRHTCPSAETAHQHPAGGQALSEAKVPHFKPGVPGGQSQVIHMGEVAAGPIEGHAVREEPSEPASYADCVGRNQEAGGDAEQELAADV